MKTTDELIHEISQTSNILDYLEANRSGMLLDSLPEHLEEWLLKKGISKADVVRRSHLNHAYVYQIFPGKSTPPGTR